MCNFCATDAGANFPPLSLLVRRDFRTTRGGSLRTEEYIAPTVTNVQCKECRLIPHAGKSEACIRVHGYGNTNLRGGIQNIHCFAKGRSTDSGRGFAQVLDIVGCVAAGLGAPMGRHVPFTRTRGGDPTSKEVPELRKT